MGLGIPPLEIKILLEPSLLKSIILVQRLGVGLVGLSPPQTVIQREPCERLKNARERGRGRVRDRDY